MKARSADRQARLGIPWVVALAALSLPVHPAIAQTARRTPGIGLIPPVLAPSLEGGVEWLNSNGPIGLAQLRGKIVVLDFWTYCCINCIQTLPDLKQLERAYPNEVVVIGVHAPKFQGERDTENIREAILRYGVEHPVVNDANAILAKKYLVEGWPSLRVIDPRGYVIASHYGEATYPMLNNLIKPLAAKYRRAGLLDETPLRFDLERYAAKPTPLRFPGKILADERSKRLFIADSAHNRIVIASFDGQLQQTVGRGPFGQQDGSAERATFGNPQGLAILNDALYVADTDNHLLRRVDLTDYTVTTVAGTGKQSPGISLRSTNGLRGISLASPWDLCAHEGDLYIAMAGAHQIWRLSLQPPRIHTYAGNGAEDIVDGPLLPRTAFQPGYCSFAQPSGLATDGVRLFVADSEGSTIRSVPIAGRGDVSTLLGTARLPAAARLFTFGDRDGPLEQALLQHPLGIALWQDRLFVADTYNNKLKEIDLSSSRIRTLAGDGRAGNDDEPARFNEPAGISVADGVLYVADTNNHQVRTVDLRGNGRVTTLKIKGLEAPPEEDDEITPISAVQKVSFGRVALDASDGGLPIRVKLDLPSGVALNPDVPPTYTVKVTAGDPILAKDVDGKQHLAKQAGDLLDLALPAARRAGTARVEISLAYFYCDSDSKAICRIGSVTWTGELRLGEPSSDDSLLLRHAVRPPEIERRR